MKRIRFKVLCLLLLGIFWLGTLAQAASIDSGIAAYKRGEYTQALSHFKTAVKENPKDPKAMFYLGLSLTKTGYHEAARQAFEMVTRMVPADDPLAAKARNNMAAVTNEQISAVSSSDKAHQVISTAYAQGKEDNYLPHVLSYGRIIRFDEEKMPLKVFISSGQGVPGWQPEMTQSVLKAMQTWQQASRNKVRFTSTSNLKNAHIVVRWQKVFKDSYLGLSPTQTMGNTLIQSDVILATYYPDGKTPISLSELNRVAIHELGHAIGLKGHSPFPEDVMYYTIHPKNTGNLTARDIKTIGLLYAIEADVKNSDTMSMAQSQQYFEAYKKAREAYNNNELNKAIAYFREAVRYNSQEPEAKFLLATALLKQSQVLIQQSNYLWAKKYVEESISLYEQIKDKPDAPPGSQYNHGIAKKVLFQLSLRMP